MIKVGITGGIGSGKTTVCKLFETCGIPVYYADDRAKEILNENRQVIRAVKKLFGKTVYDAENKLKRREVAEIVFQNKTKLKLYNAIIHPAVFRDFNSWVKKHKDYPYIIKEAALLFETGAYRELNAVITVTAPKTLRLQRVMLRDKISRKQVLARIENQWTENERKAKADFQIKNDGNHILIQQVYVLHTYFTTLAGQKN